MPQGFSVGWRQVWVSLILVAAVTMVATTYSILAVPLEKEFQTSRMTVMLSMTIMAGTNAVLSPIFGSLMDRLSLRVLSVIGAACLVAGYLALSFATSFVQVLIIFGLFMAPAGLLAGPMMGTVLLARWFTKRRGRAMGMMVAGVGLGGFVFPPIIQALLDGYEWREALRILALLLAVIAIPPALLVVDHPSDRGLLPDGETVSAESAPDGGEQPMLSVGAILRDPAFWLASLLFAIVLSGMQGTISNLVPLAQDAGIEPRLGAYFVSIYAIASFVAKLAFAGFADKFSPRGLIVTCVAGYAVGMACLLEGDLGFAMIALGTVVFGFFGGLMMPLQSVLIPRIFGPNVTGRASGLINFVLLLFMLAAAPLFGRIFDLFGSYDAILIIAIGLAVAVLVLVVPFIRLHPRGGSEQLAAA